MRLTHAIVILTILCPTFLFSQSSDLTNLLDQLASEIKQVESKKYTYGQAFTYDAAFPFRASFAASRTDSKGKSTTQILNFNLKDFDANSIRMDKVKDVIVVQMNVEKKQNFIGMIVDDKRSKYSNELEIISTDVDNSRLIMDLLKKIIPLAKSVPPAELLPTSFDSRITWLEKNISKAEKDGKPIEQKIKSDVAFKTRLVFEAELEGKKGSKKELFGFNLIDVQKEKIKLEVKGKNIFLKVSTKEKYIRYEENGSLENFKKDFKIYASTIETGKMMLTVFQSLVEESPKQNKEFASKGNLNIETANDGKYTFQQKIDGQCLVTFESKYENKKGETIIDKSLLHLDDLNPKSVEIKVSKKTIWINSSTDKSKKFINNFQNDELQKFSKKIGIRASNIENARVLEKQLKAAIDNCEGKSECVASNQSVSELMDFSKKQIGPIVINSKTFQQKLEPTGESEHQWKFTLTKPKKKGEEEFGFVFNLADIDPKAIDFKVSKKVVVISLRTNKGEEIIKTYKNSEPDNYEKEIEIYVADIVSARQIVCAMKTAISKL